MDKQKQQKINHVELNMVLLKMGNQLVRKHMITILWYHN